MKLFGRSSTRRRWRLSRGSRGATEAGFALIVAALVAGAVLGKGLAATNVFTSDGLSWLGDDDRGTAVQINPATGQPQTELKVSAPGNQLDIAQRDGVLVVNDTTTGEVTVIDVATLLAGGRRSTTGGGATKILIDPQQLYLVDRPRGTVHRIDPRTAADVGAVWLAGTPIADAVIDGAGLLWVLGIDGRLHRLRWTGSALEDATDVRKVTGAGPQSVLVPHDAGVTVFAPEAGSVTQVGTGREQTLPAPQLGQPVLGAPQAPAGLVPATVSGTATVVILRDGKVITIPVGGFGCPRPGDPVVHNGRIYVPCLGSNKVLVLDGDGTRQTDIPTPGGDPKLVIDDGRLLIHVPGTNVGLVVNSDGSTRPLRTHDDNVPVQDPATPPPPLPTPSIPRRPENPPPGQTDPPGGPGPGTTSSSSPGVARPPAGPSSSSSSPSRPPASSSSPPAATLDAPTNVAAQARPDGTVLVTWAATGAPTGFMVLRADTGVSVASVAGGARQAIVTTVAPGESVAFVVEANFAGTVRRSAASAAVGVFTIPGAPGPVSVVMMAETASTVSVEVRWGEAAANGSTVTDFDVIVRNDRGFQTMGSSANLSMNGFVVPCQGACSGMNIVASVQARNAAGLGPSTVGSLAYVAPVAPVITEVSCEYTGGGNMVCDVAHNDTRGVSIRWTLNGSPISSNDNKRFARFGCGGLTTIRVTVTVSNIAGSDTRNSGVGRCTGPAS